MAAAIRNSLVLGGIYALLLLSVLTPFGLLSWNVLMVPLIAWMVISPAKAFLPVYAGVLLLILLLPAGLGTLLFVVSLACLPASAAMAWQYRRQSGPFAAVFAGAITWTGVMLAMFAVLFAMRVDLVAMLETSLLDDPFMHSLLQSMFGSDEQVYRLIRLLIDSIPMAIILFAVYQAVLAHWLSRKILTRFWQPVPRMRPMKDWRLPRSFIWYYLAVLVLDLFVPYQEGSLGSVLLLNALPLIMYALAIQGFGFLFFLADAKGWNRAFPITAIVVAILFTPLIQLAAWLGMLDLAFPLRDRLKPNR